MHPDMLPHCSEASSCNFELLLMPFFFWWFGFIFNIILLNSFLVLSFLHMSSLTFCGLLAAELPWICSWWPRKLHLSWLVYKFLVISCEWIFFFIFCIVMFSRVHILVTGCQFLSGSICLTAQLCIDVYFLMFFLLIFIVKNGIW